VSTLVADDRLTGESAARPSDPHRTATPVRAPRRRDQVRGPSGRPVRVVPAPSIMSSTTARAQACRVSAIRPAPPRSAPPRPAPSWRLTERGVAVVLVVALMLAVAALTVIGLTAVRVTSPSYQVSSAMPVATVTQVTAVERPGR